MDQYKIWDYLQNDGLNPHTFSDARQRFMLRYLMPSQYVLNIGVGSGTLERLGIAKGVHMYTLDPSRNAIERLRNSLGMAERAQVGCVESMPNEMGSDRFDTVVMSEVLEHIDNKIMMNALNNVLRVLKPLGTLLVSTPYKEDLNSNTVICPECGKVFHKFGHVQAFDKQRMRLILERSQFNVEKIFLTSFVDWQRRGLRNLFKSAIRIALARLGEGIADPHLVVLARKSGKSER